MSELDDRVRLWAMREGLLPGSPMPLPPDVMAALGRLRPDEEVDLEVKHGTIITDHVVVPPTETNS